LNFPTQPRSLGFATATEYFQHSDYNRSPKDELSEAKSERASWVLDASIRAVGSYLLTIKGLSVGQHVINRRRSLRYLDPQKPCP